jgi:hypothetical protein
MKIQDAINLLSQLDPQEEVMIEWYSKEDLEIHLQEKLSSEEWNLAVGLFQKAAGGESNFETIYFLQEARERLAVK